MKLQIIELHNQNKNSEEIAKILQLKKKDIDIILLEHLYSLYPNSKRLDINLVKSGILDKNQDPLLSNILIGQKYGFSSIVFGKILKLAGIYFKNSHYKDKSILTNENIELIINKFKSGISINSIAKEFNLNHDIISKLLRNCGINTKFIRFDETIFDNINTEEKAYWLGFLFADGYVSNNRNVLEISLQAFDIEHLFKFKSFVKSDKLPTLNISSKYNRCRFSLNSLHLKESLIKLGCTPRKSLILKQPNLDNMLIKHFIRGYFDGDGCLSYSYTNPNKSDKITISCNIVGTYNFLNWISLELKKNFINSSISKCKDENAFELNLSKNNSIKFTEYLYNDCNIYLSRKYERFLYFLKNNFAVLKSDFLDNDRAISEKAKGWIETNLNKKYKLTHANTEIITETKESVTS